MDNRPIGVFDSGIGGLTVVKEILKVMPNENIVYFGDTARVPYGDRSEDTIKKFTMECISFLKSKNIKLLIVACNTVSAVALDLIREELGIETYGVILPGSKMANRTTKNHKIGVIGTNATVNNGAYEKAILFENDKNVVYSKSCPLFVPIAEDGLGNSKIALDAAKYYLKDLMDKDVDCIVMGCTHYPILETTIKQVVGDDVKLINPAKETVKEVREYLIKTEKISSDNGRAMFFVTDDENKFKKNLKEVLEIKEPNIKKINLKTILSDNKDNE